MEQKKQKREYKSKILGVAIAFILLLQAPFVFAIDYTEDYEQVTFSINPDGTWETSPDYHTGSAVAIKQASGGLCTGTQMISGLDANFNIMGWAVSNSPSGDGDYEACFTKFISGTAYWRAWASFTLANDNIIVNAPVIDGFDIKVYTPDNIQVSDGYEYIGEFIKDFRFDLVGTNNIGLYDNFSIDISQDESIVVDNFNQNFNLSCDNCTLESFLLSDIEYTFLPYHKYYFNITMESPLANSIIKDFTLYYDVTSDKIVYEECATADIACYFKNALRWAFTIPASTWQKFTLLKNDIETKPPFGYGTSAYNALLGIDGTAEASFELEQSEPINDLIFTPIRTGMAWFLYFLFLFALVKRFMHIQI
jgi:hypothetical protein